MPLPLLNKAFKCARDLLVSMTAKFDSKCLALALLSMLIDWIRIWTQHAFDANNQPTSLLFGPNFLASRLYQLSPPEDLELALSLVRPHLVHIDEVSLNEAGAVTKEKYGTLRQVNIVNNFGKVMKSDVKIEFSHLHH